LVAKIRTGPGGEQARLLQLWSNPIAPLPMVRPRFRTVCRPISGADAGSSTRFEAARLPC
jgi:hypothetical protein